MFCDNCGNQLREGALFCPKCGTSIKTNTELAEQEYTPFSPKSDKADTEKPIQEGIKDIDEPLFKDDCKAQKLTQKKKSKKKLIIALCVVFTVLVGIGVIVLFEINQPPLTLETAYDKYIKDAYEAMINDNQYTDNKQLLVIEGASHTDIYDGGENNAIPFDKLEAFYNEYLR